MENTRLSNGKVALITIGCLIAKVIIWIVTWFTAILMLVPFLGTEEPAPTPNTGITALQIRNNTIELTEGQSIDRYFQVTATGDFSESDLKLISSDTGIVTVKFKEISLTNYVYFTMTGISEGTAEIYFETADGSVRSEKIAVTVRSNGASTTDESNDASASASDSATASTDTASTDTKTNVSTSTKPASTSTQKPAASDTTDTPASASTSTSTQKPATSDAQTNSETPASSSTNSSSEEETTIDQGDAGGLTIYKTPTGKRYHYDPDCAGKNATPTTIDYALKIGLTPCKTCVE